LTARLGFAVADNVTPLKLVEKGFRKDNLALIVTIAFPFEFIFAIFAGRLSANTAQALNPVRVYCELTHCSGGMDSLLDYVHHWLDYCWSTFSHVIQTMYHIFTIYVFW
jgi:hypothetical protein